MLHRSYIISSALCRAGLFWRRLPTRDDVREAILQAVEDYDTICVRGMRSTGVTQALFGSIPEEIGEKALGTVVISRGPQ